MEIFIISPSEKGKKGQIVRYLHDSNEIEVIADSFDEYLEKFMEYGLDFISEDIVRGKIMFFNYYNEKVYYEEFGEGKPILIIHGLACNIELMKGCIEPIFKKVNGYKRIYIDLLGMGKSNNCSLEYASSDKILEMLLSFIKEKIDKEFLLIGESYGGYLSRGIVSKCYKNIDGLMLLCPMIIPDDSKRTLPKRNLKFYDKKFLESLDKNKRELFSEYMIITNEKLYKRFEKEVISGIEQANNDFIEKLKENYSFTFNVDKEIEMINFSKPSLFIAGRQDNAVGYHDLCNLIEDCPRATFVILDIAGHNLQIEQEEVFNSLFLNWLERVEKYNI